MKQGSEIEKALRDVAKMRDRLLHTAPALSSERRAALTRFLALRRPVEVALREVAARRDHSLHPNQPKIPLSAESALHQQLQMAEAVRDGSREWRASDWQATSIWRRSFRSPRGAVLAACAVIAAAILSFDTWGRALRRNVVENLPQAAAVNAELAVTLNRPPTIRTELFGRRIIIGPFNLDTREPASLEAAFVSNRRIHFADGIETPLGLRLDLPVRATLMEDGLARTP